MPEILGFSKEVLDQLRTVTVEVLYGITEEQAKGPLVAVAEARCDKCGRTIPNVPGLHSAAMLRATKWNHRLDWKTGKQCGGQFLLSTVEIVEP